MSVIEWVLCGAILVVLIAVAISLCRRPNFNDCAHCPLRAQCVHPTVQKPKEKEEKTEENH